MKYQSAAVRDLVWALESPPIFLHRTAVPPEWGAMEVEQNRGLLARLDQPNSAIQKAVARRATNRLGEYFEILVSTWLDEIPPARLLGSNVQVHGSEGTIGEFDLLFTRDRATHHWELAVKYYLGFPGRSGPDWLGPDPRDVLQEKWKKMRRAQLRLSQHPLGRKTVRRLGGDPRVRPAALVKGWLFDALNPRYSTGNHPHVNPAVPRGFWVHRNDLAKHPPNVPDATRWTRLGRLRWMAPLEVTPDELASIEELVQRFDDDALFVAGFVETEGGWHEITRGFVVRDDWPRG